MSEPSALYSRQLVQTCTHSAALSFDSKFTFQLVLRMLRIVDRHDIVAQESKAQSCTAAPQRSATLQADWRYIWVLHFSF